MIRRIVKLSFHPEQVTAFLELFHSNKEKIRGFSGCISVDLLRDIDQDNIFFTYSLWDEPSSLESYRKSELFKSIWSETKIKFNDKPEAWSVKLIDNE